MHKIREQLMRELKKYEEKGELSAGSLDVIHKLTDTIKNIDKIEMLEEASYTEDDSMYSRRMSRRGSSYDDGGSYYSRRRYSMDDSYDGGDSYARRGQHYVRGHYSRAEGKEEMMSQLEEMMQEANGKEKDAIKRCMEELKRG